MPIADLTVRLLADANLSVALTRDGAELSAGGYRRQTGRWHVEAGRAKTSVTFGPFDSNVRFTGAALYDGNDQVRRVTFDGPVQLPALSPFTLTVTIGAADG